MAAALNGTAEEMKILIDHGANPNFQDSNGISALWIAVPDLDKTQLLLDKGANPQLYSKQGYTVLVKLSAIAGSEKIFRLLMAYGGDPRKAHPIIPFCIVQLLPMIPPYWVYCSGRA